MRQLFFKEKYATFDKETPFDFAKRASIGCGGKALAAFYPKTMEEALSLLNELQKDGVTYYVLGNLTNVLPGDEPLEKAIISTKKLCGITPDFFSAGITSSKLLNYCKANGLGGAEFLEGIPCTLGGALYMNAGVNGKYIAEIVKDVCVYKDGKQFILPVHQCGYSYKRSIFMDEKYVILGARLQFVTTTKENVVAECNRYKQRRAHLPKGKSMGCVFKNPQGKSAGELIEKAGLKGLRVGGAVVSQTHANFIINDNQATAKDICVLIEKIKQAVFAFSGISLEEEIRYINE